MIEFSAKPACVHNQSPLGAFVIEHWALIEQVLLADLATRASTSGVLRRRYRRLTLRTVRPGTPPSSTFPPAAPASPSPGRTCRE